jgi:hypothetical protein
MQLVTDSREPFTDNATSLLVSPSPLLACTSLGCILIAGVAFYHGGLYFHLDWFQGVLCKRSAVLQPLVMLILIPTYLNKQ